MSTPIHGADGSPWRPLASGGDALPETRHLPAIHEGEVNDLRPHPHEVAGRLLGHAADLHRMGTTWKPRRPD